MPPTQTDCTGPPAYAAPPVDVELNVVASNEKPNLRELEDGILVDSGAGASVANGSKEFPEFAMEESPGSRAGQCYIGPGGKERLPNTGQRKVRVRLCHPEGPSAGLKFQDADVRRPILSVGESTDLPADNTMVFDRLESVVLERGSPEQLEIRRIIRQAKDKLILERKKNIFELEAWVEEPDSDEEPVANNGQSRPFAR